MLVKTIRIKFAPTITNNLKSLCFALFFLLNMPQTFADDEGGYTPPPPIDAYKISCESSKYSIKVSEINELGTTPPQSRFHVYEGDELVKAGFFYTIFQAHGLLQHPVRNYSNLFDPKFLAKATFSHFTLTGIEVQPVYAWNFSNQSDLRLTPKPFLKTAFSQITQTGLEVSVLLEERNPPPKGSLTGQAHVSMPIKEKTWTGVLDCTVEMN